MKARFILFRRHLARLRANRSVAIGLAFGIVFLALLSLAVYLGADGPTDELSAVAYDLQRRLWPAGSLYDALVFVLAIVLGSSMVNDDVKVGTIFGVLARPVSRTNYFLGSWLAAATLLLTVDAMRCAVSAGAGLAFDGHVPVVALVGMIAALAGDVLRLAIFGALGAALSTGVAVSAGLAVFFIQALAFAPQVPSWVSHPLRVIAVFLPLSTYQEVVIVRSLTGAARDIAPLVEIIGYRLCWTAALVVLGIWAFQRREIAPRI